MHAVSHGQTLNCLKEVVSVFTLILSNQFPNILLYLHLFIYMTVKQRHLICGTEVIWMSIPIKIMFRLRNHHNYDGRNIHAVEKEGKLKFRS